MADEQDHMNLTVVALVALVAIIGLVALVMNAATVVKITTGSRLVTAAAVTAPEQQSAAPSAPMRTPGS